MNKLGHPNYKVGARVAELLESVTQRQPEMREVMVGEVERVVYRFDSFLACKRGKNGKSTSVCQPET